MATIESSIMLMDGMSKPLNNIIGAINTTIAALQGVNNANVNIETTRLTSASQMITEAGAELARIEQEIQKRINNNTNEQNKFNQSLTNGVKESDSLLSKISKLATAYLGLQTLKGAINLSDSLTQTTARLDLMNDGNQTTSELQSMIFQSAQNSRGDALGTMDSISKMGLMAGDAFSSNTELIKFMELINKQFKISGTSAEGISAAMLQLTQAMGAGALRGEELNSILEQAPLIVRNIAEYMNVPVGQIKDLASQGKITSEVVKNAMFNASDKINSQFESIPLTFTDIINNIKSEVIQGFIPISNQITQILNSENFKNFTNSIVMNIGQVISIAQKGINIMIGLGSIIYDSWGLISPILKTITALIGVYTTAIGINTLVTKVMGLAQLGTALAMTIYNVATGKAIALTHQQTIAQWGLNSAILANPIVLVVGGIVAALYLGVAAFNHFAGTSISATGIIVGAFYAIGAVIHNVIGAVYNATLQLGSSIYNFIAGIVEFIGNVFTHPITAICNLFLDFTNFIINQLKVIGRITDTILGTSVSDSLEEIQSSLNNFVLDKVGENSFKVERKDFSEMMVDYKDPWQAAKNGYNAWENFSNAEQEKNRELLGQIATNTGAMADSLDLTTEEIKYMKDLAEMEVINRFTTAEVRVEVGGITNQVNSDVDLETVYSGIEDKLREAIGITAAGRYD